MAVGPGPGLGRGGRAGPGPPLACRHAAARPQALGFLHVDGHTRACYGTRTVQKRHIARLKFPAPATEETWVTSQDGEPVFMVAAEPSDSLAGELRRLLPQLRQVVGDGRRVTVCFDRGGWSPALFADITGAGFDLLTWRKGPAPDIGAEEFTTISCADDRGLARALDGHYARAGDEAYALIREALTTSGDICPGNGQLLIRLDPLTAPRRTQALAAICDQLNQTQACYPGTDLTLRYEVKPHPGIA